MAHGRVQLPRPLWVPVHPATDTAGGDGREPLLS